MVTRGNGNGMKKLLFPLCHIFRTIRAMLLYGIRRVIVGENKTFMGEEELLRSRGVSVEVIHDETCIALMRDFIAARPELWNEDIGVVDTVDR